MVPSLTYCLSWFGVPRPVHDYQGLGVQGDGLRDLDDLLVGDRETLGRAVGVDADAEAVEQRDDLGAHGGLVDASEAADGLASHEDVLRDRQVGEQGRLLGQFQPRALPPTRSASIPAW